MQAAFSAWLGDAVSPLNQPPQALLGVQQLSGFLRP